MRREKGNDQVHSHAAWADEHHNLTKFSLCSFFRLKKFFMRKQFCLKLSIPFNYYNFSVFSVSKIKLHKNALLDPDFRCSHALPSRFRGGSEERLRILV
jgi:hypothetical protein